MPRKGLSDKRREIIDNASIQITFQRKDYPVATIICQILGHGSIIKNKNSSTYNYITNDVHGLVSLANLLNGVLRGPKYDQFVLLTQHLIDTKNLPDFLILPRDTSSVGSNS